MVSNGTVVAGITVIDRRVQFRPRRLHFDGGEMLEVSVLCNVSAR